MMKMEKPTKQKREPIYNYNEVIEYIEKKYGIETRDYYGKFKDGHDNGKEYCDFWHFICDHCEIYNGCSAMLFWSQIEEEDTPKFVKEIAKLLDDEGFFEQEGDEKIFSFLASW